MANRNLHTEFKGQLQPKNFKYSEEYWNNAEQMLNEAQPKKAFYFNKTTAVLSVIILALLGITIALNKKNNYSKNIEPNTEVATPSVPLNNNNAVADEKSLLTKKIISNQENDAVKLNSKSVAVKENSTDKNKVQKVATQENIAASFTEKPIKTEIKEIPNATTNSSKTLLTIAENNKAVKQNAIYTPQIADEKPDSGVGDLPPAQTENKEDKIGEIENNTSNEMAPPEADIHKNTSPPQAKPKLLQNYFRVGLEMGASGLDRSLTTKLDDCIEYVNKRNDQEKPMLAYSANVNFGQQINRWQWQVGLGYVNYQEDIFYNNQVLQTTGVDKSYWDIKTQQNSKVDSSWAIDSIFVGHWIFDTTVVTSLDSNYITQWDSVGTWQTDSTVSMNNGIHSLSYFEVPVFFGYSFGKNNWFLDVQPGFSVGFLTGSRGSRYVNKKVSGLVSPENQTEQFKRVIWKTHLRIGVRYSFKDWDLGVYPHYSVTLNNILKTDDVFQRYQSFGVMLGGYYKF